MVNVNSRDNRISRFYPVASKKFTLSYSAESSKTSYLGINGKSIDIFLDIPNLGGATVSIYIKSSDGKTLYSSTGITDNQIYRINQVWVLTQELILQVDTSAAVTATIDVLFFYE